MGNKRHHNPAKELQVSQTSLSPPGTKDRTTQAPKHPRHEAVDERRECIALHDSPDAARAINLLRYVILGIEKPLHYDFSRAVKFFFTSPQTLIHSVPEISAGAHQVT